MAGVDLDAQPGGAVADVLDGGGELLEVDLERVEDLVGVVLGSEADFPLTGPGVLDDFVGGAFSLLRGPDSLTQAWLRWSMVCNATRDRGLRTSARTTPSA